MDATSRCQGCGLQVASSTCDETSRGHRPAARGTFGHDRTRSPLPFSIAHEVPPGSPPYGGPAVPGRRPWARRPWPGGLGPATWGPPPALGGPSPGARHLGPVTWARHLGPAIWGPPSGARHLGPAIWGPPSGARHLGPAIWGPPSGARHLGPAAPACRRPGARHLRPPPAPATLGPPPGAGKELRGGLGPLGARREVTRCCRRWSLGSVMRGRWLGVAAGVPGLPGRLRAALAGPHCAGVRCAGIPQRVLAGCSAPRACRGRLTAHATTVRTFAPGGAGQLRALITPALRQIPANSANYRNGGVISARGRNARVMSRMVPAHTSAAGPLGPASLVTSAPRERSPARSSPRVDHLRAPEGHNSPRRCRWPGWRRCAVSWDRVGVSPVVPRTLS